MWFDPTTRKQIIIGVLSSLTLIFLVQPFLHLCWTIIDFLGTNVSDWFSRGIYTDAALGLREVHSFIALTIIVTTMMGLIAGTLLNANLRPPDRDKPSSIHSAIERAMRAFTGPLISIPLGICFTLIGIMVMTERYADLQLNASFNQRMAVLAPEISDLDAKRIHARWASMHSREDYLAITAGMEAMANQKGVKLPKVLWD